jgi:hypothetical protein
LDAVKRFKIMAVQRIAIGVEDVQQAVAIQVHELDAADICQKLVDANPTVP